MADKKVTAEENELLDFELVTETYNSPTQTRRNDAGSNIARSGYGETNTNGTDEFDTLVTLEGHRREDQFSVKFGANAAKGMVAAYLAKAGEDGATTVKRSKDMKVISFHIGHIFDKYPTLRPAGEVFCTVKQTKDAKGLNCVMINVRGGTPKKGRASSSSSSSSSSESTSTAKSDSAATAKSAAAAKSDSTSNQTSTPTSTAGANADAKSAAPRQK
ncbi:MAG TPA: hypothetical protein VGK74_21490 [Symbiobacteriaceae bacterium]|jgi:hypothetical protein